MKPYQKFQKNLAQLTDQIQRGETQLTWQPAEIVFNPKNWKSWLVYILMTAEIFFMMVSMLWLCVSEKMPMWFIILTAIFWAIWFYLPFSVYPTIGDTQKIQYDRTQKKLIFRPRYGKSFVYERAHQHDSLMLHINGLTLYYDYGKTHQLIDLPNWHDDEIQKEIYLTAKILAQAIADDFGLTIVDETPFPSRSGSLKTL